MVSPALPVVDLDYNCPHVFHHIITCELAAIAKQTAPRDGHYIVLLVRVQ